MKTKQQARVEGTAGTATPRQRRERTVHGAREKSRAVLSVWAERRKPTEMCRELGITWAQLSAWQERAMEGMLVALEPKTQSKEPPPALGTKLEALLEKKSGHRERNWSRLQDRLTRIQEERTKEGRSEPETG